MKKIELPNGSTAVSFVPEDSKDLAIVHIATIKKLAGLLQHASPASIIKAHIDDLQHQLDTSPRGGDGALKQAIKASEEFTAFHKTINLIQEYKPESKEPKLVGSMNINNDEENLMAG